MKINSWFLVVFFFLNLLISSFYLDIYRNANTTSRALPIIVYFEDGAFSFDKYHELTCDKSFINGHFYTDKAPLPTLIVLPFFGILHSIGIIYPDKNGSLLGDHVYLLGGFLTASLPYTIILLMAFLAIRNQRSNVSHVLLCTLPFYASFIFVFTGTYFSHILSGILLLASYLFLQKNKLLFSGIFAGLSFLCEYNLAVIFLIWGVQMVVLQKSMRPLVNFAAGVAPSFIFILFYNYHFTGSPFIMLYRYHNFGQLHDNYGFSWPGIEAVWGLSFSWYKGLFFYAPFLLFSLILIFKPAIRQGIKSLLLNYITIPAIVFYFVVASYFGWWGGWTYGPRFLLALAILLTYQGIVYVSDKKFLKPLFWILIGFGLTCSIMARTTVGYSVPTDVANPMMDLIIPKFLEGEFSPNNVLTIFWGLKPLFSFILFMLIFIISLGILKIWHDRIQQQTFAA